MNVIVHSQGPWEKHKYIKVEDGKYFYPDSYEGGRHLPDNKHNPGETKTHKVDTSKKQPAIAVNGNDGSPLKTGKLDTSNIGAVASSNDRKEKDLVNESTKGSSKDLGLFTKKDLRKRTTRSISELQKLLSESKEIQSLGTKIVEKVKEQSVSSVSSSAVKAVEKVVEKVANTVVNSGPDLSKVYEVYNKTR